MLKNFFNLKAEKESFNLMALPKISHFILLRDFYFSTPKQSQSYLTNFAESAKKNSLTKEPLLITSINWGVKRDLKVTLPNSRKLFNIKFQYQMLTIKQ